MNFSLYIIYSLSITHPSGIIFDELLNKLEFLFFTNTPDDATLFNQLEKHLFVDLFVTAIHFT